MCFGGTSLCPKEMPVPCQGSSEKERKNNNNKKKHLYK